MPRRIEREKRTVEAMIALYCADHHGGRAGLCEACAALRDYAWDRLDRCRFADEKPTCSKCPVHCYRPAMRQEIQSVMRYAGPRMMRRHPLMGLRHVLESLKGRRRAP